MAQLRQDYGQFVAREAEILVTGPDDATAFARYWAKEGLPYVGLPDPTHRVADLYGQQVNWLKLGRMPALVVVDKAGCIRFAHYGSSMRDLCDNATLLALLNELNREYADTTRSLS